MYSTRAAARLPIDTFEPKFFLTKTTTQMYKGSGGDTYEPLERLS